ncbi:putative Charged multivesicular body protein 6 [Seiridium cardinale]|uniref:Charged multivesicular body protein 6 n=1 Tax=Seiridium cardinale TaxID=138064 RepID=A0ABR2Y907_9PEZI
MIAGAHSLSLLPSNRAILDLKLQRDKLRQYQRRILPLVARETEIAKQMLAANDKPKALLALRRKKYQEQLLEKTDAQLQQLEQLVRNVEFAQIQKDIVFGLQQGTKVLKEINAEMGGIERVEMLMGESAEAIAYQNVRIQPPLLCTATKWVFRANVDMKQEISEMLGGRITNQDEEEVEDELAALEAEINGPTKLPDVPNNKLPEAPQAEPEPARSKQRQETREAIPA